MEGTGERTLRAKYLDWCSARLAERFLDLSPEEIYALARPEAADAPEAGASGAGASGAGAPDTAASEAGVFEAGPPGSDALDTGVPEPGPMEAGDRARVPTESPYPRLPHPTDEGYRVLVQRVTEVLLRRTSLPTFEQWSEAYAESPDRFEAELLGFWKDAVPESPEAEDPA